ncbi:hypothetical protein [Burkholderia vietnamiensis]|uniref:hypothetical protein n=1 Tax=Burkholderia vietnamiensis TaxID=60552 RepID=UPI001CF42638|nr:hypothetical protein [Burkholderia vietnamiensis]MCA8266443.1 hypothetical protein [Burkholderia vietnamiensis]
MNAAQTKAEIAKHAELLWSDLRRGSAHVRIGDAVYLIDVKGARAEDIAAVIADAPKTARNLSRVPESRYFVA